MAGARIRDKEWKPLLSRAGGICSFPNCETQLTESTENTKELAFVGDYAHIVADSRQGPRGNSPLSDEERDKYDNLILLCKNCHARIDKQPKTYSVAVIRQMKHDHELRIASRLSANGDETKSVTLTNEKILSSLLPVLQLPNAVFAAPCGYGDHQDQVIKKQIEYPESDTEIVRFIVREETLYSFHDLRNPAGPFASIINVDEAKKFQTEKFLSTAEGHRRYVTLLNRALYKYTDRLGLRFDPSHSRFYFPVLRECEERSVKYRPMNRKTETRQVAWEEKRKSTGEGKGFWWHLAASIRFHRVAADQWVLSIRPERHLTTNGQVPLPPEKIGRKVTRLKASMFNDKYLSEVNFWRDFLSSGNPRFHLDFGSQSIAVSTEFVSFDVAWPGIPGDTINFRNQSYEEDLFSHSLFNSFNQGEEDDDWDDQEDDGAE